MTEQTEQKPINPYGQTKLTAEQMLKDFHKAYGTEFVSLRYFNAAGADLENEIGEDHNPETHLIPLAIQAAHNPQRPLTVMGSDYATDDGTCVRDYIHVSDLAKAHVFALSKISELSESDRFLNLGTGVGTSILQIISMVEKVTQKKVTRNVSERRLGDPPVLIANGEKAKKVLGWQPRHSDIETIITTANSWYLKSK